MNRVACKCGREIRKDEESSKIKVIRFDFFKDLAKTYSGARLGLRNGLSFIEDFLQVKKELRYSVLYCNNCGRMHVTYRVQSLEHDRLYEPQELKNFSIFNDLKDSTWDKFVIFVGDEYSSFVMETKLITADDVVNKYKFNRIARVSKDRNEIHLYNYLTKKIIVYKLSKATQKLIDEIDDIDEKTYATVVYDDIKATSYSYKVDRFDVEEGDRVIVERGKQLVTATVESIDDYCDDDESFPYEKLKEIKGIVYDKKLRRKKVSISEEDIPKKYQKYFIFPEEVTISLKPNNSIDYQSIEDYSYKMFINSNPGSPSFTFELAHMMDFDGLIYSGEYLMLLDSDGYKLLHPFLNKFIKDYSVYDFTNLIKPFTFEKMKDQMDKKIAELKKNGQRKQALFLEAFIWYFYDYRKFCEGSNDLLNIEGF